ncbi:MAG: tRNA (adenosine(37)-N6)-threonylcarbamoyltransferase complex ATPase subunit type 1 TsaE [Candidatus Metalachnospira sp.]|nr:tRNA (adenosine(37)-N6)-threonylcarbamoyltransferase complex ATPase subunit type 1 TsaE [Candidatus Metalachnospira sp.]
MIKETYSQDETEAFGREIGIKAKAGDIYCLSGDLGVGKTVFTRGFARGLDIDDDITSPTFTLINEYYGRIPMYHFDVYRVGDSQEMEYIGCDEYFFGNGVCLIEWAEMIEDMIPENAVWIKIEKNLEKGMDYRCITFGGKK